ncbi:hypothetical protein [Micromonospora sp. NPDC005171]|uniref:hypothetical protein n=1 Tax=Micromonospora sp. NPDC005171 TaxID=3156866 RepID=UPI0033B0D7D6
MTAGVGGDVIGTVGQVVAMRPCEARQRLRPPLRSVFGTGTEPHWGLYLYEHAACLLKLGRAAEVPCAVPNSMQGL